MWKELDIRIGIRSEITPSVVPGLNVGFVLNDFNDQTTQSGATQTLGDVLMESVLGLPYTYDYFALRFSYRLDSDIDYDTGDQMIYRIEGRIFAEVSAWLPDLGQWRV